MARALRVLVAAAALAVAAGAAPVCAYAAGDAVIAVGTAGEKAPGAEFSVPVTIKGNPGFASAVLTVDYAEAALELVDIDTAGGILNGKATKDVGSGTIGSASTQNDKTGDGTLFTLKFRVKDGAASGRYEIGVGVKDGNVKNFVNADVKPVSVTFAKGNVVVGAGSGTGSGTGSGSGSSSSGTAGSGTSSSGGSTSSSGGTSSSSGGTASSGGTSSSSGSASSSGSTSSSGGATSSSGTSSSGGAAYSDGTYAYDGTEGAAAGGAAGGDASAGAQTPEGADASGGTAAIGDAETPQASGTAPGIQRWLPFLIGAIAAIAAVVLIYRRQRAQE
jgi:hypothetical protein